MPLRWHLRGALSSGRRADQPWVLSTNPESLPLFICRSAGACGEHCRPADEPINPGFFPLTLNLSLFICRSAGTCGEHCRPADEPINPGFFPLTLNLSLYSYVAPLAPAVSIVVRPTSRSTLGSFR